MVRVVLLSLDSFLHRHLTPSLTPRLWELATEGGFAPDGGRCDLPSVTYPSHASMLSGRRVGNHGVLTGRAGSPAPGVVPGWAGDIHVAAPTLFDACAEASFRTAAVLGDHKLYQILSAGSATSVWPTSASVPEGLEIDAHRYMTNSAIHDRVVAAVDDPANTFVFAHYNETDTWGHIHGPDAPETLACYAAADAMVGEVADALRGDWGKTVLIVLSDHGMELLPERPPVNLFDDPGVLDVAGESIDEAAASLLRLRNGVDSATACRILERSPGVASCRVLAEGVLLVEAIPGVIFGSGPPPKSIKAGHGGPTTTRTLAVVSGGHPAVARIVAAMQENPPHLADWAPTIASILDFDMPGTDGSDLASEIGPRRS
jgi:arylsulfatase A-like enzyme